MQKLIFNLVIVAALILTTVACSSNDKKTCNGSCDSIRVDTSLVSDTLTIKTVIDSIQP